MDFITILSILEKYNNIIVVIDKLSKGVIADGLEDIETKTIAKWFLK